MPSTKHPLLHALRRAAITAFFLSLALPALAQDQGQYGMVRWPGGDMYTDANFSSASMGPVPRGEKVEFLQRDGIWWKVRWQGKEGWMNRIVIEKIDPPSAAAPAAALPVSSPPTTPNAPLTAPATAAAATPAAPAGSGFPSLSSIFSALGGAAPAAPLPPRGRAVVFGISTYESGKGIPSLKGVTHDMESASAMAQLMGISPDRITVYRDGDINRASMTSILTQLAKDVSDGDPVLLYYSGHGSRRTDPSVPGGCVEGLLLHDGQLMTSNEMLQLIQPIAAVTDGLFVFFDSCFSGGLSSTRAVGNQRYTSKAVVVGGSNCKPIANMLQQTAGTRATGKRYVYAAAARADEVSLDDAENGGMATSNFLRCMVEGNGGPQSVDAIRACAQAGINMSLANNTMFKPQNMTITGDLSIKPVRADLSPAYKEQLLARAAQGILTNRPAAAKSAMVSSTLVTQGWPQVSNSRQALEAIGAHADPASPLLVETPQTLVIDKQALQMKVKAPADGYLYVFQATGDGKNAYMLFPNTADRDNRVKGGQSLDLPRASWPLVAGGPEGDNKLMVIFSKTERDIGQLVGQESGPFLDLAVSPIGMQALALAISRSAHADEAECKASGTSGPAYCAANFSASIKTIREIRQ